MDAKAFRPPTHDVAIVTQYLAPHSKLGADHVHSGGLAGLRMAHEHETFAVYRESAGMQVTTLPIGQQSCKKDLIAGEHGQRCESASQPCLLIRLAVVEIAAGVIEIEDRHAVQRRIALSGSDTQIHPRAPSPVDGPRRLPIDLSGMLRFIHPRNRVGEAEMVADHDHIGPRLGDPEAPELLVEGRLRDGQITLDLYGDTTYRVIARVVGQPHLLAAGSDQPGDGSTLYCL